MPAAAAASAAPVSGRGLEQQRCGDAATFLREDARTRAELETRQGWTVNAARLALCAPWILLLLLSSQPDAVRAYDTSAGTVVLLVGGGTSLLAYRVMLRVARLPTERRVLR